MQVCFFVFDIFGMGGTARTVLNIANFLAEHNFDVRIISVFRKNVKAFFPVDARIQVDILHDTTAKRWYHGRWWVLMSKVFRRIFGSIAVHRDDEAYRSFSLLTDIKILSALKSIDCGVLVTTRPSFNILSVKHARSHVCLVGQEHLHYSVHKPALQQQIRQYYRQLDYLITLTTPDTYEYKSLLAGSRVCVRQITNSVPAYGGSMASLDAHTVIAAGRLVPQKGFDLLIASFKTVVESHPQWILKIFGQGIEEKKLEQEIQRAGLSQNVFLMGPSRDITREFTQASIYVLSSRFEGFGMVIVEAMQCGLPVVSFDCPYGPGEIIHHGEDGLLVAAGDVDGLATAILHLVTDTDKRRMLGKRARENARRFETPNIGRKWIDLLTEINDIRL